MPAVGMLRNKTGVHGFEVPKPKITLPNHVLVRIKENGVCTTDLNMVKHDYKDIADGRNEIVLGHEMMGVVEEVGSGVKKLRPGDAVTMTVRRGCGTCAPCNSGRSDFCHTGLFKERGLHKLDGFLTQYVVDEEKWIVKIPKGLEKYGTIAEPLSVVEKALEQLRFVQSRMPWSCSHAEHSWQSKEWGGCKRGLVLGVGPIGFLAAALLRLGGVETIVVARTKPSDSRVKLTKKLGCAYYSTGEQSLEEIGEEITGGGKQRLDLLFEAVGASEISFKTIPWLSRDGACVLTGIPRGELKTALAAGAPATTPGAEATPSLDANLLMRQITRHNLVVVGSVNSNKTHFEKALADMKQVNKKFGKVLDEFITMRVPLKQYEKAFGAEKIMKAVVQIS